MLVAPVVDCETSAPPTTPRGTSRSTWDGLTTFMASEPTRRGSLDRQRVVDPLRALGAHPVVDLLRARIVLGRLPRERRRAVPAGLVGAGGDQRVRGAGAAGLGGDEQVVHYRQAARAQRLPGPVDGREADRAPGVAAGDQLD